MAILIPSKNIYGDPEVNKENDNKIRKIEISASQVKIDTTRSTTVHQVNALEGTVSSISRILGSLYYDRKSNIQLPASNEVQMHNYSAAVSISAIQNYIYTIKLSFARQKQVDAFIGEISEVQPKCTVTVEAEEHPATISTDAYFTGNELNFANFPTVNYAVNTVLGSYKQEITLPLNKIASNCLYTYTDKTYNIPLYLNADATVSQSDISYQKPSLDTNTGEYTVIAFDILCPYVTYQSYAVFDPMKSKDEGTTLGYTAGFDPERKGGYVISIDNGEARAKYTLNDSHTTAVECSSIATTYKPTKFILNIQGDLIELNVEKNTVTVSSDKITDEDYKTLTINNSKLLQGSDFSRYESTIKQYENGKETVTLLCDISDYYEYDHEAKNYLGEKKINITEKNSTLPAHIKNGDEVVPMKRNAKGTDEFMSVNKDGTPKIFKVVKSNIFYDGAVWNEISLLERN